MFIFCSLRRLGALPSAPPPRRPPAGDGCYRFYARTSNPQHVAMWAEGVALLRGQHGSLLACYGRSGVSFENGHDLLRRRFLVGSMGFLQLCLVIMQGLPREVVLAARHAGEARRAANC
ncbi:hypothetical protein FKP32DRAFT_419586 [Trametes sanguinea]|nr:hypothetical protein FKP32DRAFT_419586 [Trametes sanguinea]